MTKSVTKPVTRDNIGIRMKKYESVFDTRLVQRTPVIVRVDGKAFHGVTSSYFKRGYSDLFMFLMKRVAMQLAKETHSTFVYGQSDEISLLLIDYQTLSTQGYFDYRVNKLNSVLASLVSSEFMKIFIAEVGWPNRNFMFDARCFNVPKEEVCNYFIWRQQDATRNAIQMAGQENFSPKQLHNKSCNQIQEMLFQEKEINFDAYETERKRGYCVIDKEVDFNIPIFSQDRSYVERHVYLNE